MTQQVSPQKNTHHHTKNQHIKSNVTFTKPTHHKRSSSSSATNSLKARPHHNATTKSRSRHFHHQGESSNTNIGNGATLHGKKPAHYPTETQVDMIQQTTPSTSKRSFPSAPDSIVPVVTNQETERQMSPYHSPLLNFLLHNHPPQTHQLVLNQLDRMPSENDTGTASQLLELDQELESLVQVWREYSIASSGSTPLGCISALLSQHMTKSSGSSSSRAFLHILREALEIEIIQHFGTTLHLQSSTPTNELQSFSALLHLRSANDLAHPNLYLFNSLQLAYYFHSYSQIRTHIFDTVLKPRFLPSLHSTSEKISLSNIDLHRGELQNLLVREVAWLEREIDFLRELIEKEGSIRFKLHPMRRGKTEDYVHAFNAIVRESLAMTQQDDQQLDNLIEKWVEESPNQHDNKKNGSIVKEVSTASSNDSKFTVDEPAKKRRKNRKKRKKAQKKHHQDQVAISEVESSTCSKEVKQTSHTSQCIAPSTVQLDESCAENVSAQAVLTPQNDDEEILSDDGASINLKDEGFDYPSSPQHAEAPQENEEHDPMVPVVLDEDMNQEVQEVHNADVRAEGRQSSDPYAASAHHEIHQHHFNKQHRASVSIYGYCATFNSEGGCPHGEDCQLIHASIPEDLQQEWRNQQYFSHDPQQKQNDTNLLPPPPQARVLLPPQQAGSLPHAHPPYQPIPPMGTPLPPAGIPMLSLPPQSADPNYLYGLIMHQHQWIQQLQHSNDLMHQEMVHMRQKMEMLERMIREGRGMDRSISPSMDDDEEPPCTSLSDM